MRWFPISAREIAEIHRVVSAMFPERRVSWFGRSENGRHPEGYRPFSLVN
jgi:hypothetical protein